MPTPDFSKIAADYGRFRPPFPEQLFTRLAAFNIPLRGQHLLDLAAGAGSLTRRLNSVDCTVVSLDISGPLLRTAPNAVIGRAEQLPFADHSFDGVIAAQSWHWFDRTRAPAEIFRILRPGGFVAALYQMYIPLPGSIAHHTEQLILRHNPSWRHANSAGINGQVLRDLQLHRFTDIESFTFDVQHRFTRAQWQGLIRTTSPVAPSMSPKALATFENDHAALLEHHPEPLKIPHRIFAAIARRPLSPL